MKTVMMKKTIRNRKIKINSKNNHLNKLNKLKKPKKEVKMIKK